MVLVVVKTDCYPDHDLNAHLDADWRVVVSYRSDRLEKEER